VAIFACTDADLLEALPLPCPVPERAVLGTRPHIRPLLAALQRRQAGQQALDVIVPAADDQRFLLAVTHDLLE